MERSSGSFGFSGHFLSSNNPLRNSTHKVTLVPLIISKDFYGKILLRCLYLLQIHFGFSSFSPPDNALEACGLLTPLHIVPEWYFLCQYAMLKAVPNKNAGFIILFTFIFILFYLCMLHQLKRRSVCRGPIDSDRSWFSFCPFMESQPRTTPHTNTSHNTCRNHTVAGGHMRTGRRKEEGRDREDEREGKHTYAKPRPANPSQPRQKEHQKGRRKGHPEGWTSLQELASFMACCGFLSGSYNPADGPCSALWTEVMTRIVNPHLPPNQPPVTTPARLGAVSPWSFWLRGAQNIRFKNTQPKKLPKP